MQSKTKFKIILIVTLSIFTAFSLFQPVSAGLIGPPPPSETIISNASVRVYHYEYSTWQCYRKYFVEVWADIGYYQGNPKLVNEWYTGDGMKAPYFFSGSAPPLWGDYEYDYSYGGYHKIGYKQIIAWRVTYGSDSIDFELFAKIHVYFGDSIGWSLGETEGDESQYEFNHGDWKFILFHGITGAQMAKLFFNPGFGPKVPI